MLMKLALSFSVVQVFIHLFTRRRSFELLELDLLVLSEPQLLLLPHFRYEVSILIEGAIRCLLALMIVQDTSFLGWGLPSTFTDLMDLLNCLVGVNDTIL